jgi:hypothetical protein
MPWIIVLGGVTAIEWVLANERMAVNPRVRTLPEEGDAVAVYTSRGAYHSPSRDQAQILAIGLVAGAPTYRDVTVGNETYAKSFPCTFNSVAPLRRGLPFLPLVPDLEFITKKQSWGGALRRPLVRIPDSDFQRIENAFRRHLNESDSV